ncbi:leucine-rich repeat extensin-like protein 3 [Iris pallida]|uniref:Leucine-rich repeat extensin-like protein 3 n=1 Tax=Iris pallida TaxID=29817 RepID=A0AAX6FWP2_IRIPA|nr:leucine-rich repeat extensin-like protein 3 [Iris pallida]KAJ6823244.1 leucine-rich repeat extensin-like protein 3 [Iris pallida]
MSSTSSRAHALAASGVSIGISSELFLCGRNESISNFVERNRGMISRQLRSIDENFLIALIINRSRRTIQDEKISNHLIQGCQLIERSNRTRRDMFDTIALFKICIVHRHTIVLREFLTVVLATMSKKVAVVAAWVES